MDWLWWLIGVVVGLFAIDRLFLWFEAKGWLYWRKTRRRPGGMGDILTGFGFTDPGVRHLQEARQEKAQEEDEDGDDDDKRKPEDQVSSRNSQL